MKYVNIIYIEEGNNAIVRIWKQVNISRKNCTRLSTKMGYILLLNVVIMTEYQVVHY